MKILVTGVAGFIGSHTAKKLLQKGDEVVGLDNFNDYYNPKIKEKNAQELSEFKNFKLIRGDILDYGLLEKLFEQEKFDKVCHLAARAGVRPSIEDPFLYEEVNVRGTLNLLELSRQHNIKNFVFASSSSVYGESKTIPFSEEQKLDNPISPYAATKKSNENFAYTYSNLYNLPCVGLRYFTVYGPSGRPDMAPFLFTKWIYEGKPLKRFGDGSTARDYTFVDDIANGTISALDFKTNFEIFNLGNGSPVKLNDFIAIIEKKLGKKAIIQEAPMQAGDVPITYADTSKAKKLLNFEAKVSIEQGIDIFADWFKKNYNLFN